MKTELMYKLVLTGRVRQDYSKEEVKAALVLLLKRDAEEVERIFASAPVVVKTQLPESQLQRYLDTFGKTGAVFDAMVDFKPLDGFSDPDPEPPPPAPQPQVVQPVVTYAEAAAASAARTAASLEEIRCPRCNELQPKRTLCRECGVNIPNFMAGQSAPIARVTAPPPPPEAFLRLPQHEYDGRMAKLFDIWFDGRIGRLRYVAWNIPAAIAGALVMAIVDAIGHVSLIATTLIVFLAVVAIGFFTVRVAALRLHDFGKTGWIGLVALVPIANVFFAIWLLVMPGHRDDNAFGDAPKKNTPGVYVGVVALVAIAVLGAMFH